MMGLLNKLIPLLKCNQCASCRLRFDSSSQDPNVQAIECQDCNNIYPIVDQIILTEPHLFLGEQRRGGRPYDQSAFKSYSNWWLKVNKGIGYQQDVESLFYAHTGKKLSQLDGQVILDAGTGGGRFLRHVSRAESATIVAFDLGEGLRLAKTKNEEASNIFFVQGDILNHPFRDGVFDFIYSIGVFHSLPDPKKGFEALSKATKEGGSLAVHFYHSPYKSYKDRGFKYALSTLYRNLYRSPLRRLLSYMPHTAIYLASVAVYYIARFAYALREHLITRPIGMLVLGIIPPSEYNPLENKQHNIIRHYDTFSSRYIHGLSFEEALHWFQDNNFNDIEHRKFGLSMVGTKQRNGSDNKEVRILFTKANRLYAQQIEMKGLERETSSLSKDKEL